jgi:hypothetical protein
VHCQGRGIERAVTNAAREILQDALAQQNRGFRSAGLGKFDDARLRFATKRSEPDDQRSAASERESKRYRP